MVVLCTEDYIRTLALLSLPPLLLHITASRKLFTNHRGGGRRAGRQAPLNAKTSRAHGACMATAVGSRHPPLAILYSYVLLCTLVHSSSTRYRSAFLFPLSILLPPPDNQETCGFSLYSVRYRKFVRSLPPRLLSWTDLAHLFLLRVSAVYVQQ